MSAPYSPHPHSGIRPAPIRWLLALLICAAVALLLGPSGVRAQAEGELVLTIQGGTEEAIDIAIVPFGFKGASFAPEDLANIIARDLRRSGRFNPLARRQLPARPTADGAVDFLRWRAKTSFLVVGMVESTGADRYLVRYRLFDVLKRDEDTGQSGTQLDALQFERTAREMRETAHDIADRIYESLTGEPGAFNSRIAYITETKKRSGEKTYRLKMADSDGYNAIQILEQPEPIMSPAWSPDGSRLAYVSFQDRRARIFVQQIATGRRSIVSDHPGINGAPAFSPDGTRLAMTLSKDGNAEIYVLHLRSQNLRRITRNPAIDTEPEWSPDGKSLVFTSDRSGGPQIYRVSANGGEAKRITFDGGYNAGASFAPSGQSLAVVHRTEGGYRIGLVDLDGNPVKVLTRTRLDDSPSFAPNGAMVLYSTTDIEGPTLTAVTVDGGFSQTFALESGIVRDPAWGPAR